MNEQPLEIKAEIQISKPVHDVFEVIVDRAKISNYSIARSSRYPEPSKNFI